jgi:hypothetical protein
VCVAIVAVAACAKQEPEPQQTARTSDAAEATSSSEKQTSDRDAPAVPTGSADIPTGSSSAAKERALKARDALFDRLLSELTAAMFTGGPSAAIEVCSQKAPQIAASVGKEQGVAIGRTSFRLRNPANQPPEWATQFVEERVAQPQFVELEGGEPEPFCQSVSKPFVSRAMAQKNISERMSANAWRNSIPTIGPPDFGQGICGAGSGSRSNSRTNSRQPDRHARDPAVSKSVLFSDRPDTADCWAFPMLSIGEKPDVVNRPGLTSSLVGSC